MWQKIRWEDGGEFLNRLSEITREEVRGMSSITENMETLEQIAATIAHEIKNPLALALANLELIKVGDTAENYKKHCDIIEQELYKINQLVIDFIHNTLSKGTEESFDITAMLDELTMEYQRRYESITFYREPNISPSPFWGIVKSVRMVFTNILNNAVEAISEEGIIEILQESTPSWLHIKINDNGVGCAEELLRLQSDFISTKKNGTGIGLPYCRRTIAKYGGRFMLQNRPQGGCSVSIELPVKC
jgi:signal transduction histidine kinase